MRNIFRIFVAATVLAIMAVPSFAADYTMKIGTIVSETHADYVCMNTVFKKYVESKSGGKIAVEIYPNAQLGGDREMTESVQMGTIQACLPSSSTMAGFDKRFQVLDLPFLFTSRKMAFDALDGELGKKLDANLTKLGFVNLGYAENGFRHVTNSRGPVVKPADMKGMKLRTMENPMHIAFFKMLGANPTPMSFGELYTALQQKTVDGEENPIAIVYDAKFYEVQKFMSMTGHVFSVTMLLTSKKFLDGLPADLRKIVEDGGRQYAVAQRKLIADAENKMLEDLKKRGMKVNTLTDAQKAEFVKATRPTYDQFAGVIGNEIMDIAKKLK